MKRLRVAGPAERDLDEIWHFIAQRSGSIDIANRIIDSITQVFPLLAQTPKSGRPREDIDTGLRGFTAGKYIVYYKEVGNAIIVSRILHGTRDQNSAYFAE